jgi:N-acetyl-anhydromuramyl-L-alanine amidase AmpD
MLITIKLENENKSFSEVVYTGYGRTINNKIIVDLEIDLKWRDKGPKESLYDLYLSAKVDGIFLFDSTGNYFTSNDICNERLLIKDFFVDEEGFVINPRVETVEQKKIYSSTTKIFKDKSNVHAVVLHRTNDYKGSQTLNTAKASGLGAHFTVEGGVGIKTTELSGKDGAVYQFGSLLKSVKHAGEIRKRPPAGTPKLKWSSSSSTSHSNEIKKKYPDRFPYNGDSIGIEVVGKCLTNEETLKKNGGWEADWEKVTDEQIKNTAWLTNGLLQYFSLGKEADLYVHEQIRSKTWDEGGVVLRAIKQYIK